ncbi:MAG: hypothetical protein ABIA47_00890 [bacterium]
MHCSGGILTNARKNIQNPNSEKYMEAMAAMIASLVMLAVPTLFLVVGTVIVLDKFSFLFPKAVRKQIAKLKKSPLTVAFWVFCWPLVLCWKIGKWIIKELL